MPIFRLLGSIIKKKVPPKHQKKIGPTLDHQCVRQWHKVVAQQCDNIGFIKVGPTMGNNHAAMLGHNHPAGCH